MLFGNYNDPVTTLAEEVVNSYRHSSGQDVLSIALLYEIARCRGWHGGRPTSRDVNAVRALRPALRQIFEMRSVSAANELVAASHLAPKLVQHDELPWHFHLHGADATLPEWIAGHAAYALLAVIEGGGSSRLRRCAAPECHAVFVDLSRNHSRRYCSPTVCGNRAHVAAHRDRQRATSSKFPHA